MCVQTVATIFKCHSRLYGVELSKVSPFVVPMYILTSCVCDLADCQHRWYGAGWCRRQGNGAKRHVTEAGEDDAVLQEESSTYLLVLGERRV